MVLQQSTEAVWVEQIALPLPFDEVVHPRVRALQFSASIRLGVFFYCTIVFHGVIYWSMSPVEHKAVASIQKLVELFRTQSFATAFQNFDFLDKERNLYVYFKISL